MIFFLNKATRDIGFYYTENVNKRNTSFPFLPEKTKWFAELTNRSSICLCVQLWRLAVGASSWGSGVFSHNYNPYRFQPVLGCWRSVLTGCTLRGTKKTALGVCSDLSDHWILWLFTLWVTTVLHPTSPVSFFRSVRIMFPGELAWIILH